MKTKNIKDLVMILFIMMVFLLSKEDTYAQSGLNYKPIEIAVSAIEQKGIIEFQKQKDSIISWYSNRVIENRKYQRKFKRIQSKILNRLEKTTLVRVPRIKIQGIAEWKHDTVYYADIVVKEKKYITVFTHELAHDAFPMNHDPLVKSKSYMKKWMIDLIDEAIKKTGGIGFNDIGLFLKYYNRPDEVYARICAFRVACDLKPNQKCAENDLLIIFRKIHNNDIIDHNSKDLLVLINNEYCLLDLLNNLP